MVSASSQLPVGLKAQTSLGHSTVASHFWDSLSRLGCPEERLYPIVGIRIGKPPRVYTRTGMGLLSTAKYGAESVAVLWCELAAG